MAVEIPHFGGHNKAVWIGLALLGVAAGLYLRHRSSSNSTPTDPTVGDASGPQDVSGDPTSDPYSSGSYNVSGGIPGPPGPPGKTGKRGPRGPRGPKGGKHGGKGHKVTHHTAVSHVAAGSVTQAHGRASIPAHTGTRVIRHNGPTVQKGSR
jgi:hypothetical protein